jgi:iron complex outermembrane recepter protein
MRVPVVMILLLLTAYSYGQNAGASVSGTVAGENKEPLESANISLLKIKDSALVSSVSTGKSGQFSFPHIAPGHYLLSVTAVGSAAYYSDPIEVKGASVVLPAITLKRKVATLQSVGITATKPFIEQRADRTIVNVDASPSSAGSSVLDVLEKSPGVTIDKDGNISLKGKQGVTIMIDNKPTYMTATQLANYLKGLPASAIDQLEIMTNPSAKYDAAGNSGIINIKTKKNKAKGFNGSLTLTHTQGVYAKPGGSLNLNYRNGKFNLFANGGYTHWKGFHDLDINREYYNADDQTLNSIFTQTTNMVFTDPEFNIKAGADFYLNKTTTLGFVVTAYQDRETDNSKSLIYLKDPNEKVDSIVHALGNSRALWKNNSYNLNFRKQFDSLGAELTADADYVRYKSTNDQLFDNTTYYPDMSLENENMLRGDLPSTINIYTFKTDYSKPFRHDFKLEAGFKISYVATDNQANYFNVEGNTETPDSTKTNYFVYHENINAGYVNFNKKYKKWNFQAGLRVENTIYSGHQFGNKYTVVPNDSSFHRNYINAFPTAYITYSLNDKNQFSLNVGRRIDRPDYGSLNPFLFYLDQYTYQAGNPYLQPQYTTNVEFSHTYKSVLTTTLNYSHTRNYFSETFEQVGHATVVRNGNIGERDNAGISVSLNLKLTRWWTSVIYTDLAYNHYQGLLYGDNLNAGLITLLGNINNEFKFNKGWGAELSGFYRTSGIEGQIYVKPMGQVSSAVSKQILKDKGTLKLGLRDMFYTNQVRGTIDFQQTAATFHNSRDSRQLSLTFVYRFGKTFSGPGPRNHSGADDESNRVKSGGNK